MRIGNIDDLGKTGNTENLINIIQTEEYRNPSKAENKEMLSDAGKYNKLDDVSFLRLACLEDYNNIEALSNEYKEIVLNEIEKEKKRHECPSGFKNKCRQIYTYGA